MGLHRASPAVADAGPLIHLAEIGCLRLTSVFDPLHISEGVWLEAGRHAPALDAASVELPFRRHPLPSGDVEHFVAKHGLSGLQRGECEALCLCRRLGIPVVLTDDLAVREAAKALRIVPVGSLGIPGSPPVARAGQRRRGTPSVVHSA